MIRAALAVTLAAIAAPALAQPAPAPAPAGVLIGPALNVGDIDRSIKFYVDGLGMKVATRRPGPQRIETILMFGGPAAGTLLLMSDAAGAHPVIAQSNGFDRLVMRVPGLDATAARLKAAGFASGPIHVVMNGKVRVMGATDPDGYRLELVEMASGTEGAAK